MISKKTDQGMEAKSRKILKVKSREKCCPAKEYTIDAVIFFYKCDKSKLILVNKTGSVETSIL